MAFPKLDMVSKPGFFIALEGPDGSGKTTQAALLAAWLRDHHGLDVVTCRDPGGTDLGDRLRSLLLDRSQIAIDMRSEMLLYMASRAQLVAETIRPALDRGQIVVTDRFLLSNVAYQGFAGGLGVDQVWQVGQIATNGLFPDLTFLVDVTLEVAKQRLGTGRDRIEDRSDDYRRQVRQGFLDQAQNCRGLLEIIDGSLALDQVQADLRRKTADVLGLDSRT